MSLVEGEVMHELFYFLETNFLHIRVRVDNQLVKFEWTSKYDRWKGTDLNDAQLKIEARTMLDLISKLITSSWAHIY
jgi:hypothetical protein